MYSWFIIQLYLYRNMCSIIPHDTQIVARVVKNSPIVRGNRMFFTVFKLSKKTNKRTLTKYVLLRMINYPHDDCKNNLNKLAINIM